MVVIAQPLRPPRRRSLLRSGTAAKHALLVLACFLSLAPFLWLVSIALRPVAETYVIPMPLLPTRLTLENFVQMSVRVPQMVIYYRNSFVITGAAVAAVVVISSLAGYAFARLRFPGRDVLFWLVVATMFLPSMIAVPTLYKVLSDLELLDTWLGLILPYTGWYLPISVFIMRGVFTTIPKELEDAARIDGCAPLQLFWRIMLPLGISGAIVVAIFAFVPIWGEYLFSFTFTSTTNAMPMSVGIRFFEPTPATGQYTFNVATAAALVMFLPSMLVYLLLQRWFTKGMMEGALKF
jgi:ABC-type glycerol-3-phosphate transport system permease component